MGAYVSTADCKSHYNITIECYFEPNDTTRIASFQRGQVPTDADIAGIGVVSSFLATTAFALILSIISVLWLIGKRLWVDPYDKSQGGRKPKRHCQLHLSEFCEELVMSASDAQIFTGSAYAITLRYFKGCSISAYHYNIVANMMLLTCATHLMSITIVRNYWKWPWLGILRTLICTGVFIVTGILLANQNSDEMVFPSVVPKLSESHNPIFLPAACFQKGNSELLPTLKDSVGEKAVAAWFQSTPGNMIPGWNNYLMILLLYLLAGVVDIMRSFRRGVQSKPDGRRARIVRFFHCSSLAQRQGRQSQQQHQSGGQKAFFSWGGFIFFLFALYLLAGIGVSSWTVVKSGRYMFNLRSWAKQSGWLQMEDGGQSAEDDATSFGQLVPIFLNLMLIFASAQILSKACWKFTDRSFDMYGGVIPDSRPSTRDGKSGGGSGLDGNNPNGGQTFPSESKPNMAVDVQPYYLVPASQSDTTSLSTIQLVSNLPSGAHGASSPQPSNTSSGRWDSITTVSNPSTPGVMQPLTNTPPLSSSASPTPSSFSQFQPYRLQPHPSPLGPPTVHSSSSTPSLLAHYQNQRLSTMPAHVAVVSTTQAQAPPTSTATYSIPSDYFVQNGPFVSQQQQQQQEQEQQHQQHYAPSYSSSSPQIVVTPQTEGQHQSQQTPNAAHPQQVGIAN